MHKTRFLIYLSGLFFISMANSESYVDLSNNSDNKTGLKDSTQIIECRELIEYTSSNTPGDPRKKLGKIELRVDIFDFDKMKTIFLMGEYKKKGSSIFEYKLRDKDIVKQFYNPDQEIFYITEENDYLINFRVIVDFIFDKRTSRLWIARNWKLKYEVGVLHDEYTVCRYL